MEPVFMEYLWKSFLGTPTLAKLASFKVGTHILDCGAVWKLIVASFFPSFFGY
jgi:hypothetical protein